MPAVKSTNRLHAQMNKYFTINIWEWSENQQRWLYVGINSAKEVSKYIANEELEIRLFNEVLSSGTNTSTKKIRKRLMLKFYSK